MVETFHSLQGEGLHAGRSAFFVRLAGCSVGCPWCDTKHSWPAAAHPPRRLAELAEEARQAAEAGAAFVVITGGEPLHHDLGPLCDQIQAATTSPERPAGLTDATSAELDPHSPHPVIHLLPEQQDVVDLGGTMRLGVYPCRPTASTAKR